MLDPRRPAPARRTLRLLLCVVLAAWALLDATRAIESSEAGSIAAEALRRSDDLVKEGFNLTYGITVTASPLTVELLVPPSGGDEDTVALWFAAPEGELSVRMTGPGGEVIAGWKGRRGEQRFVRALLIAMIDHARSILGSRICPRVLMSG